jgi:hypothetical protein
MFLFFCPLSKIKKKTGIGVLYSEVLQSCQSSNIRTGMSIFVMCQAIQFLDTQSSPLKIFILNFFSPHTCLEHIQIRLIIKRMFIQL